MVHQYDRVLRALDTGAVISLNNSSGSSPTDEMTVIHSANNETEVIVHSDSGDRYQIYRDRNDELVYAKEEQNRLSVQDEVLTIHLLGVRQDSL